MARQLVPPVPMDGTRRASAPPVPLVVQAYQDVTSAINEGVELEPLLHLVAGRARAVLGLARCTVYLKEARSGLYRGAVMETRETGRDWDQLIKRLVCGIEADRVTLEIVATRRPVAVPDAQHDPRPVRSAMREWGIRSMLAVPVVVHHAVIALLFLDDLDEPRSFPPEEVELAMSFADLAGIAIAQGRRSAELRTSLSTIARQHEALRQSAAVDDRLTALALEGGGLHDIAAAVAELTDKPCAVHDAGHRRLAAAHPAASVASAPRLPDAAVFRLPEVAEALAACRPGRPAVVGPLPSAGLHHRLLAGPVVARDDDWGFVVLLEHGGRFTQLDVAAVRRAATIVALELAAERRAAGPRAHDREALVRDLLAGAEDEPFVIRRAELHGLRVMHPHVVCVLQRDGCGGWGSAEDVEAARADAGLRGPPWAMTVADGALVLLAELDEDGPRPIAIARAKRALERLGPKLVGDGEVLAAMSSACQAPSEYRRGYQEARQVLRCLVQLGAHDAASAALAADDLGAARLLIATTDRVEADRFARDALGVLLDGEDPHADDLLMTLECFFASSRSVRDCAKLLGVHENTVRYRLARVADLTGLDVAADADDQLTAQVAVLILRLEQRLPTTALAEPSTPPPD